MCKFYFESYTDYEVHTITIFLCEILPSEFESNSEYLNNKKATARLFQPKLKTLDTIGNCQRPVFPFAFRCLISRPQILKLRSRNPIRGKLLLSRKLLHFRWGRFSQCLILSTSSHYSLPSKVFVLIIILSNHQ